MSQETTPEPMDVADQLNAGMDGWGKAMTLRYERATADEVIVEWTAAAQHLQPYGLVHGGVYCGVIEAACSVGAAIAQGTRGLPPNAVGLENHTSFIRAVREGTRLRAVARPLTRGKTTQLWEAHVRDDQERLIASGRVRLLCVDPQLDARVARR